MGPTAPSPSAPSTPTATAHRQPRIYTATDDDAVSLAFDITVVADLIPPLGASTVDDPSYVQDSAITAWTLQEGHRRQWHAARRVYRGEQLAWVGGVATELSRIARLPLTENPYLAILP